MPALSAEVSAAGGREPPEPPSDDVRCITLTKGRFAIVDRADYEWLSWYTWHAVHFGKHFYAMTRTRGRETLMHWLIMNPPKDMVVDHINGNSLDNRRCNLRVCTRQQNACNTRCQGGTSQYKGVYFERATGRWRATITCRGQYYHLGSYDSEIEAARAYGRKAIELFGEFVYLNFPEEHRHAQQVAATA